jgi:hypothetical protein
MAKDIFAVWEKEIDGQALAQDAKEIEENGGSTFKELPEGKYVVKITKLEVTASKNGKPMLRCYMKVVEGKDKGSMLFYNQVMDNGNGVHATDEFLRSLATDVDIIFGGDFRAHAKRVEEVFKAVKDSLEFAIDFRKTDKGFPTYTVEEVYEV